MLNIINKHSSNSGLYADGYSHAEGGIEVVVDGIKKIEVEKNEYHLCRDVVESDKVYDFRSKTNKEILDELFRDSNCTFQSGVANSGDFIICKLVVLDQKSRDVKGTARAIINKLQSEKACNVLSSGGTILSSGGYLQGAPNKTIHDKVSKMVSSGKLAEDIRAGLTTAAKAKRLAAGAGVPVSTEVYDIWQQAENQYRYRKWDLEFQQSEYGKGGGLGESCGCSHSMEKGGAVELSEADFYKKYKAQHIDLHSQTESERQETAELIKEKGFKEGMNVNASPMWKGSQHANQKGDYVYILPKEGFVDRPNGYQTKERHRPADTEIVRIEYDGQSAYEAYKNQFARKSESGGVDHDINNGDELYNEGGQILSYEEIIHSPEFKEWFGDFEKEIRIKKFITAEDILFSNSQYSDHIETYLHRYNNTVVVIQSTGDSISVSNKPIKKIFYHNATNTYQKYIDKLPELLSQCFYIDKGINKKPNATDIPYFNYYMLGINENGVSKTVYISVSFNKTHGYKLYDLTVFEKSKSELLKESGFRSTEPSSSDSQDKDNIKNQNNQIFFKKEHRLRQIFDNQCSKVVDREGRPLVVYHGTNEEFHEFDIEKQNSGWLSKGFYFTENEEEARGFGKIVIPVFLSIKNPLIIQSDKINEDGSVEWAKSTKDQIIEKCPDINWKYATECLKNKGYDGIINGTSLIAAYSPAQIKLADGSNITFDSKNSDIRFDKGGAAEVASPIEKVDIPEKAVMDFIYYEGDTHDDDNNGLFYYPNAKRFCKKWLGYELVSQIGTGTKGAAYMTDKGTVLKITTSANEAKFHNKIIGKKIPFYSDIYSVKKLGDNKIFIIEKEYLEELTQEENELFGIMISIKVYAQMSRLSFDKALEHYQHGLAEPIFDTFAKHEPLSDARLVKLKQIYGDYTKMQLTLRRYGKALDIIEENIGIKNGHIACFDCSYEKGGTVSGSSSDGSDLDNSIKTGNFANNITSDEIQRVISGISQVRGGAAIQAAASYLRETQSAGSVAKESKLYKKQEAEKLKAYIRENKLWFPETYLRKPVGEGAEQKVFFFDEKHVIKVNDAIFYNSWEDYFHSLLLHNFFFPATAYELIGFIETISTNSLFAVVKQQSVEATQETDLALVKKFMSDNGFVNTKNNDYHNPQLGVILEDLHDENVLTENGILQFIDTVFYISKSANLRYDNGGDIKHHIHHLHHSVAKVADFNDTMDFLTGAEKRAATVFGDGGQTDSDKQIVDTIFKQLGGIMRVMAMTGANTFIAQPHGVSFRIKNARANYIKIILNEKDLYDVEIGRIRGATYKIVERVNDVYADDLKKVLEHGTGMRFSMEQGGEISGSNAEQQTKERYPLAYSEKLLSDGSYRIWRGDWGTIWGTTIGVIGEGETEEKAWESASTYNEGRLAKGGEIDRKWQHLVNESLKYKYAINPDLIDQSKGHLLDNISKNTKTIMVDSSLFEKEKSPWQPTSNMTIAYHDRPRDDKYWNIKIDNNKMPPVLIGADERQLRVVDGNHRLNVYISKKIKQIPIILTVSAKELLNGINSKESWFEKGGAIETLADLRRFLVEGSTVKMVFRSARPLPAPIYKEVVRVQTNGVYFIDPQSPTAAQDREKKKGSFLEFPKASLLTVDDKGFTVHHPFKLYLSEEQLKANGSYIRYRGEKVYGDNSGYYIYDDTRKGETALQYEWVKGDEAQQPNEALLTDFVHSVNLMSQLQQRFAKVDDIFTFIETKDIEGNPKVKNVYLNKLNVGKATQDDEVWIMDNRKFAGTQQFYFYVASAYIEKSGLI